jgi:hypothetical protein
VERGKKRVYRVLNIGLIAADGHKFPNPAMTANEIINAFCDNTLVEKTASKVFPNVYIGCFEADIMELTKSGYAIEYEVKITRADFRNDEKKQKVYATQPPKSK